MALGSSSPKTFLSVMDGKIVQKVEEGTPNAVERVNKNGEKVYELKFSFVSGILTDIYVKTGEYAGNEIKSWILQLVDGDDHYQLDIPYSGAWASTMFNALLNPEVDFSRPLRFAPWQKSRPDGGKTKCLYVNQEGSQDSFQWVYTKENPGDCPPLKEVMLKGKKTYDDYDRTQFFEKQLAEKIKPQLTSPAAAAITSSVSTDPDGPFEGDSIPTVDSSGFEDDESDLPF